MILNNTPQNEAILSNVGEIGEFKIRNSAKAFSILSSGLYANKIRAIIRELSCNAVDSHVAAGKADVPFDMHLPNALEPHFAIRDYGTGLTYDQVINIYTTYFESTKTNSNDFIGALGLGSKSPFSYTDNFTVTAIKDGIKGIYSAFINAEGVPSIAKMAEESTVEPNGVEVKFSVDDRYDFDKFYHEAQVVYEYFKLHPIVSGGRRDFQFIETRYTSTDIIPGVHQLNTRYNNSVAVMGNIAYPIDIPQADTVLGDLSSLLECGLVMHFDIGELEFQASREGLSYIPATIAAIKAKLENLNTVLAVKIAEEADKIENLWDRALFLADKRGNRLWTAAVDKYATVSPIPTFDTASYDGLSVVRVEVGELAEKYNIRIRGFQYTRYSKSCPSITYDQQYERSSITGELHTITYWPFKVAAGRYFVVNDTKIGAVERAKYHFKESAEYNSASVYVLDAVDPTKEMDTDGFFELLHNPGNSRILAASSLKKKERTKTVSKDVSILRLDRRDEYSYSGGTVVWRDAGKIEEFDASATYYYVPLNGFQMVSNHGYTSVKSFYEDVCSVPGLFTDSVYGVRKRDMKYVQEQPNWVNLEEHIADLLKQKDLSKLVAGIVYSRLNERDVLTFPNKRIVPHIDPNSPYAKLIDMFKSVENIDKKAYNVINLLNSFSTGKKYDFNTLEAPYQAALTEVNNRYPLLTKLYSYLVKDTDIIEYINLIDEKKGI